MYFLCGVKNTKNGASQANTHTRVHRNQSTADEASVQDPDQSEQRIQEFEENRYQRGLQAVAIQAKRQKPHQE